MFWITMAFLQLCAHGVDECDNGVSYFLHCLPECPSGMRRIGNLCLHFDLVLADYDFSNRKNEKLSGLISSLPPDIVLTKEGYFLTQHPGYLLKMSSFYHRFLQLSCGF